MLLPMMPISDLPAGRDVNPVPRALGKVADAVIDTLTEVTLDGVPVPLGAVNPMDHQVVGVALSRDGTRVLKLAFEAKGK